MLHRSGISYRERQCRQAFLPLPACPPRCHIGPNVASFGRKLQILTGMAAMVTSSQAIGRQALGAGSPPRQRPDQSLQRRCVALAGRINEAAKGKDIGFKYDGASESCRR